MREACRDVRARARAHVRGRSELSVSVVSRHTAVLRTEKFTQGSPRRLTVYGPEIDRMVGVVAAPALAAGANWFAATLGLSTYANTAFLRAGGSAASLTLTRIGGATAIGTLVELRRVPLDLLAEQLRVHAVHFTLPAVCLFLANFFNSISLARCGARARTPRPTEPARAISRAGAIARAEAATRRRRAVRALQGSR